MGEPEGDDGFTLVETLVAIVIVTVALFALTAELAAYIHHQATEKTRTTAVRNMTSSLETARSLTPTNLAALAAMCSSSCSSSSAGNTTTVETVQQCSVTDPVGQCTTPAAGAPVDTRVKVTVSWHDGSTSRSVSSSTSVADTTSSSYRASGSGTLSSLVGGAATTATTVSVSSFTASPTSTTVSTAGVPASAVSLSLTTVGLTAATTSIPVTWTDDAGSHQWSLTGGPSTWTATIPAASISKAVTTTSTLTFAATVPGSQALVTAPLTLKQGVDISSCSLSPSIVTLAVLSRKTAAAETLSCTTSGLSATDAVKVSYPSGSGSANGTLTTTNGTTWTLVLPAGTSMANGVGLSETFVFTATRASDSLTATKSVTAVLA